MFRLTLTENLFWFLATSILRIKTTLFEKKCRPLYCGKTTSWIILVPLMNVPVSGILLTLQAHLQRRILKAAASQFPVPGSRDLSDDAILPSYFMETVCSRTR